MRRVIAVFAMLMIGFAAAPRGAFIEYQTAAAVEGTWTARYATVKQPDARREVDANRIHLQLSYDQNNMGHTWPAASLPGLDLEREADNIRVEIRADAGTIVLTGDVRRRRAYGLFDFTPNHDFARQIGAPAGRKNVTPERLLAFAIHDVSRSYLAELEALGYKDLDLDDLLAMRIHGVTPAFITDLRKLGFTSLAHEKLVAFRIHGVTPDFIRAMEAAGYKALDADDLLSARIHGVTPEFIDSLRQRGYRGLDFDDLVSFRIHGVTPGFIEEMAGAGYTDLPADRLVEFRIHGVDAEFVRDLREQGYTSLSARDLVDARIHGRRWMRQRPKN